MDSDSDSDSSVRSSGTATFRSFSVIPPSPYRANPSMSDALWASNSSLLIILLTSLPERRYLESGMTAESDEGLIMVGDDTLDWRDGGMD
jgi:hypothetical protein